MRFIIGIERQQPQARKVSLSFMKPSVFGERENTRSEIQQLKRPTE